MAKTKGDNSMRSKRRQRGMSGWVILYILATLGAAGLVGLKLIPVYLDSFKIDKGLKAVIEDASATSEQTGNLGSSDQTPRHRQR